MNRSREKMIRKEGLNGGSVGGYAGGDNKKEAGAVQKVGSTCLEWFSLGHSIGVVEEPKEAPLPSRLYLFLKYDKNRHKYVYMLKHKYANNIGSSR